VPSLLENIVKKAELCANLRLQQQRKFKASLISLVNDQSEPVEAGEDPHPKALNKKLPKNNSCTEMMTQDRSSLLPPSEVVSSL